MIISAISSNPYANSTNFGRKPKYDPNEILPWGQTRGSYELEKREDAARERAMKRDVLRRSDDPEVRRHAEEDFGKRPSLDDAMVQYEFQKYHEKVMAERRAKEAELAKDADIKQYSDDGSYKMLDEKGRVKEIGKGDDWTERYEYDVTYTMHRFGQTYDMTWCEKTSRPDGTYEIRTYGSQPGKKGDILERKLKDGTVEKYDNCTRNNLLGVITADGKEITFPKLTKVSRDMDVRTYTPAYGDDYNLKSIKTEVIKK